MASDAGEIRYTKGKDGITSWFLLPAAADDNGKSFRSKVVFSSRGSIKISLTHNAYNDALQLRFWHPSAEVINNGIRQASMNLIMGNVSHQLKCWVQRD